MTREKNENPDTAIASAAKARIEEYMRDQARQYGGTVPIFEIMLIEHPDKELIYPTGKRSGLPDTGSVYTVGFYYTYDQAAEALHENACDIHETMYDAAFLICRYPGLDNCVTSEGRVYFLWNTEKSGYVEAEEPKIFEHMAY